MAQTPAQRRANAKFAKAEEDKRGKPTSQLKKKEVEKSPISKGWLFVLLALVVGGIFVEVIRLFF